MWMRMGLGVKPSKWQRPCDWLSQAPALHPTVALPWREGPTTPLSRWHRPVSALFPNGFEFHRPLCPTSDSCGDEGHRSLHPEMLQQQSSWGAPPLSSDCLHDPRYEHPWSSEKLKMENLIKASLPNCLPIGVWGPLKERKQNPPCQPGVHKREPSASRSTGCCSLCLCGSFE